MRRRPFHLGLLIFQTLWLNVIVPGHTRGMVSLPGAPCESCAAAARCCEFPADPHHSHQAPGKPAHDPASHCAICFFAARVCLPPAIDFTPPRLGLIAIADPPAPQAAASAQIIATYQGRAPPLSA